MRIWDPFGWWSKREHPSNLGDPALLALLGGGRETAAGIDMTEAVALSASGVWAAVKTNAETAAQLPKQMFQRNLENGDKDRARSHPLQRVIQLQANPIQSAYDFWLQFFANFQLRGNAYAQIIRSNGGQVKELWVLPSKFVEQKRVGNALQFMITTKGGQKKPLPQNEVLYVNGFRLDGLVGMNPVAVGKDSISLGVAMERYGSKFFANGGSLHGLLKLIGSLDKERKKDIADQWRDQFDGVDNSHKTAVLDEGTSYESIGAAPKDSQLLDGRVFQVQEAARRFASTPSRLQEHSRSTLKNVEQMNQDYLSYSLAAAVAMTEAAINMQLLHESEQEAFFVEFNVDALLRADTATRFKAYREAILSGWMSPNEVRDKENMNPVEGADALLIPMNTMQMSELVGDDDEGGDGVAPPQDGNPDTKGRRGKTFLAQRRKGAEKKGAEKKEGNGKGKQGEEGEGEAGSMPAVREVGYVLTRAERASVEDVIAPRRALRRLGRKTIEEAARRFVRAELRELRALIKKHLGRRGVEDLTLALEEFYGNRGDLPEILAKTLGPVFEAYAAEVALAAAGEVGGIVPDLGDFVKEYSESFGARHSNSHLNQLLEIVRDSNPEDTAEILEQRLAEWESGRNEEDGLDQASKIGDREAVQLEGAIAGLVFAGLGVTTFIWIANSGACPICMELDGRVVGREEVFVEAGGTVDPDVENVTPLTTRTNVSHPPLHQGCDCTLAAA